MEGALVVVGASVVTSLVGFMVVADAFIEDPDGVELITSVVAVVVDISCDDVDRVHVEDGNTDIVVFIELLCPNTPVKV